MSYNNFKSTTVRGAFRNENYPDNSVKASSYFQNDVSISGQLYSNYINTNYINGLSISSIIYQIPNNINIQAGSSLINYQMLMTPIQSLGVSNIAVNNKIVWNNNTSTLQASNISTNTINGYSMPSYFLSISSSIYNINNVNGYQNLYLNTLSSQINIINNNNAYYNNYITNNDLNIISLSSQINTTNNNLNNFITSQNNYNLDTNNYLNTISSQIYNSNISTNTYFNNYIASNDLIIKSISGNLRYLNLYTVSLSGTVNSINNQLRLTNINLLGLSGTVNNINNQLRLTNNTVNSISGNINNINNQIININNTLTNQIYDPAYYTLNFYDSIHCYSDCILSNGLTVQTLPSYDTYYISNERLIDINYALTISSVIYNKINVTQDNTTNPLFFSFIDNYVNGAYTFRTDSGASYNPSLNSITASRFYGTHYGNTDATVSTSNYSLYSSTTTGNLTICKNSISGCILNIGNNNETNIYGYLINIGNSNNQLNINSTNTTINSNNTKFTGNIISSNNQYINNFSTLNLTSVGQNIYLQYPLSTTYQIMSTINGTITLPKLSSINDLGINLTFLKVSNATEFIINIACISGNFMHTLNGQTTLMNNVSPFGNFVYMHRYISTYYQNSSQYGWRNILT